VEASKENIAVWFQAGASAVGLGSKLISKEILASKDYQQISKKAKELIDIVQSLK